MSLRDINVIYQFEGNHMNYYCLVSECRLQTARECVHISEDFRWLKGLFVIINGFRGSSGFTF